ncbi:hypothetical protein F4860DRAFT_526598 [Xylaria cubensis]|nr:hypothetical protein F4860DRAFT_526598 [Xylaria cubensis]
MRKDGSCLAWCFPKCRTHTRRYHLQRVCRDCESYFLGKYGEHQYRKFINYFLEYKERNGWGKTAIDPRTVPGNVLLKRQSAPARLPGTGTATKAHGNRGSARVQPFQAHQPMLVPRSIHPVSSLTPIIAHVDDEDDNEDAYDERNPIPNIVGNSIEHITTKELTRRMILQRRATEQQAAQANGKMPNLSSVPDKVKLSLALPPGEGFFSEVTNSSAWPAPLYIPSKKKVLPVDPSLFVVGDDDDDEDEKWDDQSSNEYDNTGGFSPSPPSSDEGDDDTGRVSVSPLSPPPKKMSKSAPAELNIPEVVLMAQGRIREVISQDSFSDIQQPKPRTPKNKKSVVRKLEDMTDGKKLTKGAKDSYVPNIRYIEYDGNWVPIVMTPPKGKRRTRTPSPEAGPSRQKLGPTAIEISAVPEPLSIATKGSSARVKHSPSHASVAVPPPKRLDGLLVPLGEGGKSTDGVFFEERGLPSKQYIQECRSATVAQKTPILVHVPKRHFSVAVQACFCDDRMKVSESIEDKCLSCRERDLISQDMKTSWI